MNELVPVVAGFFLTTVAGGGLGYFFQSRSWRHQHDVQKRESERERAGQAFEEVSRLLDKRLYRLRQLYWGLASSDDDDRQVRSMKKMEDYRAVVYEWNDSINRNLAVIQQYFGVEMRHRFDNVIGRELVDLGRLVEQMWTDRAAPRETQHPDFDARVSTVHELIYQFNLEMLRALQSGAVGVYLRDHSK